MKVAANITIALALIALPATVFAQSANATASTPAQHLVATQGSLVQTLDAKKVQMGSEFKVKLSSTVHLDNGATLPAGSMLVGNVVEDDMQVNGTSKLALRFTHATTKDGQSIPIHATIVGIASSSDSTIDWKPSVSRVDQVGVISNVDLHSALTSKNSGVFVSTKKDDVKLVGGSSIQIAIGGGA
jgi:hypothetical protein